MSSAVELTQRNNTHDAPSPRRRKERGKDKRERKKSKKRAKKKSRKKKKKSSGGGDGADSGGGLDPRLLQGTPRGKRGKPRDSLNLLDDDFTLRKEKRRAVKFVEHDDMELAGQDAQMALQNKMRHATGAKARYTRFGESHDEEDVGRREDEGEAAVSTLVEPLPVIEALYDVALEPRLRVERTANEFRQEVAQLEEMDIEKSVELLFQSRAKHTLRQRQERMWRLATTLMTVKKGDTSKYLYIAQCALEQVNTRTQRRSQQRFQREAIANTLKLVKTARGRLASQRRMLEANRSFLPTNRYVNRVDSDWSSSSEGSEDEDVERDSDEEEEEEKEKQLAEDAEDPTLYTTRFRLRTGANTDRDKREAQQKKFAELRAQLEDRDEFFMEEEEEEEPELLKAPLYGVDMSSGSEITVSEDDEAKQPEASEVGEEEEEQEEDEQEEQEQEQAQPPATEEQPSAPEEEPEEPLVPSTQQPSEMPQEQESTGSGEAEPTQPSEQVDDDAATPTTATPDQTDAVDAAEDDEQRALLMKEERRKARKERKERRKKEGKGKKKSKKKKSKKRSKSKPKKSKRKEKKKGVPLGSDSEVS